MGNTPGIPRKESLYYDNGEKEFYRTDWMSRISGDTSIAALSIPGTHQTMARHGGIAYQCQSRSLRAQLNAGIRWLDIGCRHYENDLPLHHGMVYQYANLDDVFWTCISFLKDNSSETIILRIKEEHKPRQNSRSMDESVQLYIDKHDRAKDFWNEVDTMPTLKEARGKIVVLCSYGEATFGIKYDLLNVADKYDVKFYKVREKVDNVIAHLDEAKRGNISTMYVTYCSGSGGIIPYDCAEKVNEKVYNHISSAKKIDGES
ncbi:1-phosphatidylinositol phosphodiesterase-like [Saccoglossus kowalevskii]|uniref:Uncharacterized protein LOC102805589 n=1 Tax=Saccoglossus kowalevskii TaxID=10224 RepID=A0ABM0MLW5_SACKO|nr:PREDICTED: uncharacterized protein LOC102805589 [Saccoglossus kowalevskii]